MRGETYADITDDIYGCGLLRQHWRSDAAGIALPQHRPRIQADRYRASRSEPGLSTDAVWIPQSRQISLPPHGAPKARRGRARFHRFLENRSSTTEPDKAFRLELPTHLWRRALNPWACPSNHTSIEYVHRPSPQLD